MRKDILTVVMDIDGFLADFEEEFCKNFGYLHREYESLVERYPQQRKEITNFVSDPHSYQDLLPIYLGIDINHWLTQRMPDREPRAMVTLVTGRPFNTKRVTQKWLQKNDIRCHKLLVCSSMKSKVIDELQPDIVLDDIIGVCQQAYNHIPNVQCALMTHPWNEQDIFFPHIASLAKFQTVYEDVAREKLLSDSIGVRMAPYLPDFS